MRDTMVDELKSVATWATINDTRLNQAKLCELLVHRRRSSPAMLAPTPGVQRVLSLKILGVKIDGSLQATSYVDTAVSTCYRFLVALKIHGLPPRSLHLVAEAITVPKPLCAAQARWELATEADRTRLELVLRNRIVRASA